MSRTPYVGAATLWIGGVLTAIVSALAGVATLLIAKDVLGTPVLRWVGINNQTLVQTDIVTVVVVAVVASILATGLMHLLLVAAPKPLVYFGAISYLILVLSYIPIFLFEQPWSLKFAALALHTVVGLVIIGLVTTVTDRAADPDRTSR